ncbi:MAG: ABC transporter substrate-binding protein [Desulfobacterales bacterium]|nr:ABC transporter substrate-binding protein [Desulfobacterales bacterium]
MIKGAVAIIFGLSICVTMTALAEEPLKIIETRIDRIVKILGDKELEEDVKVKQLEKAADETFDYVYLSRMTLGRNWLKLDDSQRSEFVDLYRQLLEKNYMGQLLKYTDEKVVFGRQTMLSDTKTEVDSNVVSNDKKIPITYRLIQRDGDWKVYDLVIEGVSLVSNYRTQFNDILSRQTPSEMLAILRKKVTDKNG